MRQPQIQFQWCVGFNSIVFPFSEYILYAKKHSSCCAWRCCGIRVPILSVKSVQHLISMGYTCRQHSRIFTHRCARWIRYKRHPVRWHETIIGYRLLWRFYHFQHVCQRKFEHDESQRHPPRSIIRWHQCCSRYFSSEVGLVSILPDLIQPNFYYINGYFVHGRSRMFEGVSGCSRSSRVRVVPFSIA